MSRCVGFLSFLWALCLASAKHYGTETGCRIGNPEECQDAPYVPGHNLGGEGFDITTLERKSAYVIAMNSLGEEEENCQLCRNPFQGNVYQKLPEAITDWRVSYKCKNKLSSAIHDSSESLTKSTSSSIANNWRSGLDVGIVGNRISKAMAGTHSKLAEFARGKSAKDKYSFISQEISCRFYRYRIKQCVKITPEFDKMLKALPIAYNSHTKEAFRNVIDVFGTHYIRQVHLGGTVKDVTAIRTCEVAMYGMTKNEVKDCLDAEVAATLSTPETIKGEAYTKYCKSEKKSKLGSANFSKSFNERISDVTGGLLESDNDILFPSEKPGKRIEFIQRWITSLKDKPDVVKYSLAPIHLLKCPPSPETENLRRAIAEYILEKQAENKCPNCPKGGSSQPQGQCTCECPSSNFVTNDCCPKKRGAGKLTVKVLKGIDLHGDMITQSDAYVKVTVVRLMSKRTRTIINDNNPVWNEVMLFGFLDINTDLQLQIDVYDVDPLSEQKLASCTMPLRHMDNTFVEERCNAPSGYIIYQYKVECAPMLTGPMCDQYNRSPFMSLVMG